MEKSLCPIDMNIESVHTTQLIRLYRDKEGTVIGSEEVPEMAFEEEVKILRERNALLEDALNQTTNAVEYIKQLVTKMEEEVKSK